MIRRSSNPALSNNTFTDAVRVGVEEKEVMTIDGTVNKTVLLLLLTMLSAGISWQVYEAANGLVMPLIAGGGIVGFVLALVTIFKKEWSRITAPAYCLAKGLMLGGVSAMYSAAVDGIVMQALGLTFGTLLILLVLYRARVIKVTQQFRTMVMVATGAIFLMYLVSFVLSFFSINALPFIHSGGTLSIVFSLFVVGIAALNLVLDFDFIERGSQVGAPKYMEWYAAFGLMVTLIWLYLEILRLLAKLSRR